jgi:DMSO/TMAO reductase YedYZ molybdopterin-dependent catalytic subunit
MKPADVSEDSSGLCLEIVSEQPLNAETPIEALRDAITPSPLVYIRCNFEMPAPAPPSWRLAVGGRVARPTEFSLDRLMSMPYHRVHATTECAGNGRRFMVLHR